jgi:hypothetical protein
VQVTGRPHVVAVVRRDLVEDAVVAVDQPPLVRDHARHRVGDVLAGAADPAPVEPLELLDRVPLLADPHPLPHDRVEVHEPVPAEQPGDVVRPGAQRARTVAPEQEVGVAAGAAVQNVAW